MRKFKLSQLSLNKLDEIMDGLLKMHLQDDLQMSASDSILAAGCNCGGTCSGSCTTLCGATCKGGLKVF
jgi:hypothetical protein